MKEFYLDLGECLSLMYTVDDYIVSFEDLPYTNDVLDKLFAKIRSIPVDAIHAVVHGIPSNRPVNDAKQIGALWYQESKSDFEALQTIALALGKELTVVDFACTYLSGNERMICTEKSNSVYRVITVDGADSDVKVCSNEFVQGTYETVRNKTGITKYRALDFDVLEDDLSVFRNANLLGDDVARYVAGIFGCVKKVGADNRFIIDANVFEERKTQENYQVEQSLEEPEEPLMEQQIEPQEFEIQDSLVEPDKKKKKKEKKKKKFGFPIGFSLFLMALGGSIFIGSKFALEKIADISTKYVTEYNSTNALVADKAAQLATYQATENSEDSTGISLVESIEKVTLDEQIKYTVEEDSVQICSIFDDKKEAEKFKKNLNRFNGMDGCAITKEKGKFYCRISFSLL